MRKVFSIFAMAFIFAFIMSMGMVAIFIPASHLFAIFFDTVSPMPTVLDWIKIGISVFLPLNFILNMFVYMQRQLKAYIDDK